VDNTNPSSSTAAAGINDALTALREQKIRESLRAAGIETNVLRPFLMSRTNVATERKMSGAAWGSMLGYILLLLMFSGGMYPVMDMTVGEKERKTLEAFLVSPALRREIVMGKTLAAITSILLTAVLTLASMVYSFRGLGNGSPSAAAARLRQTLGTIPLDSGSVAMIALTLIPLAVFAASTMFAIALKARTFKEAQSYLMPLTMLVIFPALLGGLPGLQITPPLCLIPIFNASQMIRAILLGEASMLNFAITTAANLFYASLAFLLATRMFDDEQVLFRS
jgi:sodium transport system permease protein